MSWDVHYRLFYTPSWVFVIWMGSMLRFYLIFTIIFIPTTMCPLFRLSCIISMRLKIKLRGRMEMIWTHWKKLRGRSIVFCASWIWWLDQLHLHHPLSPSFTHSPHCELGRRQPGFQRVSVDQEEIGKWYLRLIGILFSQRGGDVSKFIKPPLHTSPSCSSNFASNPSSLLYTPLHLHSSLHCIHGVRWHGERRVRWWGQFWDS